MAALFLRPPKKGKKAAKNSNNNIAATIFITLLTPLLTFFIVLKYIDDNPATKPKSLLEFVLALLLAIFAAAAVSMLVTTTYKRIKTWAVFFILAPLLSMTASLVAAWYILEKPSFPDLVRPLIPFLSKLPPSEAVPPEPSVSENPSVEPGKDSVKPGESSDIKREKPQKSDKSGEISEPQSGTKPEMTGQSGSKESSSRPRQFPGTDGFYAFGMKFVYIPPGSFMMGSPENEPGRRNDETLHRVTLTQGFYMQTTEVTQKQWKDVMGDNPSFFKGCDDCPVEAVSWKDVHKFIEKLNLHSARLPVGERSRTYRLPTEAEWEYAARAGSETAYCFGDDAAELGEYAWYIGNWGGKTHPVAQKKSNAWGLYDMHGNVREWCQDWYGKYPSGDVADPISPDIGHSGSGIVKRGGGWSSVAQFCRSAYRYRFLPDYQDGNLGLRLLLPVGQHKSEP